MTRTYTYRDKSFLYDAEALALMEQRHGIDVFHIVRTHIDDFIAEGVNFSRVSVVFDSSEDELKFEVKAL